MATKAVRSVAELADVGASRLASYCAPTSNYAWPSYDLDLVPGRLLTTDLLATALLSYPIPTKILQQLAGGKETVYRQLHGALEDVIADEHSATVAFADVPTDRLDDRSVPGWGAVLRALDVAQDCPGLTSVAVTKILHRKRPNLVPIVDSRMHAFYGTGRLGYAALFACIHDDLMENGPSLDALREPYLMGNGQQMSQLRALDIIVWMGGENVA